MKRTSKQKSIGSGMVFFHTKEKYPDYIVLIPVSSRFMVVQIDALLTAESIGLERELRSSIERSGQVVNYIHYTPDQVVQLVSFGFRVMPDSTVARRWAKEIVKAQDELGQKYIQVVSDCAAANLSPEEIDKVMQEKRLAYAKEFVDWMMKKCQLLSQ